MSDYLMNRRGFMNEVGSCIALPFIPLGMLTGNDTIPQPASNNLYAIDTVLACRELQHEEKFSYISGPVYKRSGDGLIFDHEAKNEVVYHDTPTCQDTYILRRFLQGNKHEELVINNGKLQDNVLRDNPVVAYHCPCCEQGWGLENTAKDYDGTYFVSRLSGFSSAVEPMISKVIVPPPIGICIERADQDESFRAKLFPPKPLISEIDISESIRRCEAGECTVQEQRLVVEGYRNQAAERERQVRLLEKKFRDQWAACNYYLPNKEYFDYSRPIKFTSWVD